MQLDINILILEKNKQFMHYCWDNNKFECYNITKLYYIRIHL